MTKREALKRMEADLAGTDLWKTVSPMLKADQADCYWSRRLGAYFIEIKQFHFAASVYDLCAIFSPDQPFGRYGVGFLVNGRSYVTGVALEGIDQRLLGLEAEILERFCMDPIAPEGVPEPIAHFVSDLAAEVPAEASPEPEAEPPSASDDHELTNPQTLPADELTYTQKLQAVLSALYYAQLYTEDLYLDFYRTLHQLRREEPPDRDKIARYEQSCDRCHEDFYRFGYLRDHPDALIGKPERGPD